MDTPLNQIFSLLAQVSGKVLSRHEQIEKSITLASLLVAEALHQKTREEKKYEAWMASLMADRNGRLFMMELTDQCFRSKCPKRVADQIGYLLDKYGIPQFLKQSDRLKFLIFKIFGTLLSSISVPLIRHQIMFETSQVLLPENFKKRKLFFQKNWQQNTRINLNHIGEAILGEKEAKNKLDRYLKDLSDPQIEYISIKVSSVYSQINAVGYQKSLETLAERLRLLYATAKKHLFKRADGSEIPKFVNLDMEEFHDLDLTIDLFQKVLDEPEFIDYQAGIVLQSYLPNSFLILKNLTEWAQKRIQNKGAPIKIRIVKGANFSMECVEASLRGWEIATFEHKIESDANFRKLLEFACQSEHAKAVHIGVASHNLFDIAFALLLRSQNQIENFVSFEMLQGMAVPIQEVLNQITGTILLYCPEVEEKNFHSAVAYLSRRLDENSGPENFLRHFYDLAPHNSVFENQANFFKRSFQHQEELSHQLKRSQNRRAEITEKSDIKKTFFNEPDTDFSLSTNRKWAAEIFSEWEKRAHEAIPLVIGGEEIFTNLEKGVDPSKPFKDSYHYSLADLEQVEKALQSADKFKNEWSTQSLKERFTLLGEVARCFKKNRKELIGAMIADGGKTIWEADPEVSEAVDFIEYYRRNWRDFHNLNHLSWTPKGTILVTPPWNFPCSIPVSGIVAGLVTGNCVIFKPAPEAVLVGWHLVQTFWEGGIPKQALQFINCMDDPVGSYLVKDKRIASVILTGGTQTARNFLNLRPGIDLHGEAGGKNALIVTAMSDRDQAVRDIIHSAFSHSGQKCSACSLLILEAEVYDDPNFKKQLLDAAQSLIVASAWNPSAKITPLIRPPEANLMKGLTTLEPGESWLLKPKVDAENPQLWSPGIKWGVTQHSFTHQNELFGPLLAVMRAKTLAEAIDFANSTPYGLTSGLHSLDEREQLFWKDRIVAGNLYINRPITGAIVQRQPFGGCKWSSFGLGAKAGGPNYLTQFATPKTEMMPPEKAPLPSSLAPLISKLGLFNLTSKEEVIWKISAENYAYWAQILQEPQDPSQCLGQDNLFYLVPRNICFLRIEESEYHPLFLLQVITACLVCGTPLLISSPFPLVKLQIPGLIFHIEDQSAFLKREPRQIRLIHSPSQTLKEESAKIGATLHPAPPLSYGRLELLHYLREVSLSITTHRYGHLKE